MFLSKITAASLDDIDYIVDPSQVSLFPLCETKLAKTFASIDIEVDGQGNVVPSTSSCAQLDYFSIVIHFDARR